ncbi:hypothetical protein BDY17DRAFT_49423 [Neohortaea acidophila]|uniref:Uncharacterized protein n=1 Tax=Neohortaea acidophila TaxID=245834 RepID=A0A6A6PHN3_9PEZI|nr:uncharacterized protein BDY17DRAFT_49423 [Neohortaea acidophila]KAF2479103.1 hypothetical protein BDY17DRAFT_49423 [Neohortaea acidophila]
MGPTKGITAFKGQRLYPWTFWRAWVVLSGSFPLRSPGVLLLGWMFPHHADLGFCFCFHGQSCSASSHMRTTEVSYCVYLRSLVALIRILFLLFLPLLPVSVRAVELQVRFCCSCMHGRHVTSILALASAPPSFLQATPKRMNAQASSAFPSGCASLDI